MARVFNVGPLSLTTTYTTNIFNVGSGARTNPPIGLTDPQFFAVVEYVRVSNKDSVDRTFSLWKGATGANASGTEFIGTQITVPANDGVDFFGSWRFDTADFLVGGASAGSVLTITLSGTIGAAG